MFFETISETSCEMLFDSFSVMHSDSLYEIFFLFTLWDSFWFTVWAALLHSFLWEIVRVFSDTLLVHNARQIVIQSMVTGAMWWGYDDVIASDSRGYCTAHNTSSDMFMLELWLVNCTWLLRVNLVCLYFLSNRNLSSIGNPSLPL